MKFRVVFIVLFHVGFLLNAQNKIPIKITSVLQEHHFIRNYSFEDRRNIEHHLATQVAELLNEALPVFNFITDGEHEDSLTILITRKPGDERLIYNLSVQIHLILKGSNIESHNPLHLEFAPNGEYGLYLNNSQRLSDKVYTIIFNKLNEDINRSLFVDRLFRHVRLSDQYENIDYTTKKWKLPYSYNQLKVNIGSKFRIEGEYNESGIITRRRYMSEAIGYIPGVGFPNSEIIAEGEDGIDNLALHRSETFSDALGVYLLFYMPIRNLPADVSFD
ncbi:MAG: hypothetical protein ACNS60_15910 [Candidatus Cyclobacteriaceae bacterium M2_1C_046]